MENLIVATNAVIPFMVYILLGAVSKKWGLVKESFLKELNGVVFKVFFPFIMFNNLYDVDFGKLNGARYVGFAVVATLIVIVASFLLVPFFSKDNRRLRKLYSPLSRFRRCILIFGISRFEEILLCRFS